MESNSVLEALVRRWLAVEPERALNRLDSLINGFYESDDGISVAEKVVRLFRQEGREDLLEIWVLERLLDFENHPQLARRSDLLLADFLFEAAPVLFDVPGKEFELKRVLGVFRTVWGSHLEWRRLAGTDGRSCGMVGWVDPATSAITTLWKLVDIFPAEVFDTVKEVCQLSEDAYPRPMRDHFFFRTLVCVAQKCRCRPDEKWPAIATAILTEVGSWVDDHPFLLEYCLQCLREEAGASWFRILESVRLVARERSDSRTQRTFELLSANVLDESKQLAKWNATEVSYPSDLTLHTLFEAQVERTPQAPAVTYGGATLTYRELDVAASRLAKRLQDQKLGLESTIGVLAERSLEMVVALLAVLKAGGAYLPLDPSYPTERLAFMLEDSCVPVVLSQENLLDVLPWHGTKLLSLDGSAEVGEEVQRPIPVAEPESLAYMIYTSGSTGRPKGAMVTHRGICNRLLWMQDAYNLGPSDRVLQKTPFSFDVSVWEFFWPLITGAHLVMARPDGHRDSAYVADTIIRERITTLHFVPSMLRAFLEEPRAGSCVTSLRRVICSGEALPIDLQRSFFARLAEVELHNLYGPTEAAIDVTWWHCEPSSVLEIVPIGRPVANTHIHLLDPELNPVPMGEPGELCIGGVQVGRGYLNRPALTAERFVPDAIRGEPGTRLYRTGDLARYLPDGAIEYLGRIDHQVKIRGFRIELGEIEAALDEHPGVEGSVVVAADGPGGDKRLVAYLRPDHNRAAAVRRWLRLEREGQLEGQSFHVLPDGTVVAHRGKGETEFLFNELFADRRYLRNGIELRDGDCVFDVGANIGLFSLFASREAAVRIHAFEPISPIFEVLSVNAGLHGLDVRLHDCGLADRPGTAEFTYYPQTSLISGRFADAAEDRVMVRSFLLGQGTGISESQIEELLDQRLQAERHTCRLRTLSEVIAEEGIERIDLLKVDVEKSELEVLGGLRDEDWPRVRQAVVEVHDVDGRLERALDLLRRHGFEVAVEQDRMLTRTGLYNLYARRPGEAPRPATGLRSPGQAWWYSPGQLIADLKTFLRERLPDYMLPAAFVLLEEFPLGPSGKVDRKALPAPESVRHAVAGEHVAPRTPTEEALAAIWREILGRERIGSGDRFFDLGGHSLLATQVIARVGHEMGVILTLRDVFERPMLSALASLIEERGRARAWSSPIVAVPRMGDLPLSFAQERVWFLQQLDPMIQSYQFQAKIRFRGRLDPEALRRSLKEIVRRHEILRTSFPTVDGSPVQRFHPAWEVSLPWVDLSGLPANRREAEAERVLFLECGGLFDIGRLPLVRWTLIRLAPEDHVWLHVEHHLVHDGWSFNRLVGEMAVLYRAFVEGRPSPLPELPLQFADWAVWQREWMRGEEAAAQIEWWKRMLDGRPLVLDLPTDRPRPNLQSFRGWVERLEMPLELCESLRTASRREGVSLYMLMQATFAALLSRWSGQEQVNVGSAVANRRWRETESMIGMIVDNVVLADDLSGDPTVAELLQRVRRVCLDAANHQDIPFDYVVEAVQPRRDLAYNPLFQASFSFHDSPLDALDFPGLEAELTEGLSNGSAKFDLNVICIPRSEQQKKSGGGITLLWEYATPLFDRSTIKRMIGCFYRLLAGFAAHPGRRVSELPMLSEEETAQLKAWSGGPGTVLSERRVHELVEAWVDRTPNVLAIADGERNLTYGELEADANRLARRLIRLGVRPEDRVGVRLERSADLPLALLGVLKAGAAYLPLDPSHPAERLAYLLEDSAVRVLITSETLKSLAEESAERPRVPGVSSNIAYVIYTSGSTGRPKGTELPHAGVINLISWHQREYGITPADRTSQVASPAFDASVWEIWPTLAGGASLHFPPKDARSSPPDLLAWLAEQEITVCFLPTPLAEACLELDLPEGLALRALLTGGDRLHRVDRDLPFRLINHYGPSEGTVVTTAGDVSRDEAAPPIGRPIDNFRVLVLDRHLQQVPVGVAGELLVGGISLARGYLGRPELTAEKFVPDPFGNGGRLYRTGDLVRWRRDGRVEFVGRIDHQVKIRGFRVELGEIEGVLGAHPEVRDAVVVARENTGGLGLVAYVTLSNTGVRPGFSHRAQGKGKQILEEAGCEGLRAFLADRLPSYMVPSVFVVLSDLPLSPNGKVDRKLLPAPEMAAPAEQEQVAPRTPLEEFLAGLWQARLGLERVGIHDDFFELGGNSISAAILINQLQERLGEIVHVVGIFDAPTVESMAAYLVESYPEAVARIWGRESLGEAAARLDEAAAGYEVGASSTIPRRAWKAGEPQPLSFAQERLWFLAQIDPGSSFYNITSVLWFAGRLNVPVLEQSLDAIRRRHEVLRTVFSITPAGPLQIVKEPSIVGLPVIDLSGLPSGLRDRETSRVARAERWRPFDLASDPMLRTSLLRLGDEDHAMVVTMHHIASDGWSMGVILSELSHLYEAFDHGLPSPLPELPIQYADFAVWQRDRLSGETLEREIAWWAKTLAGAPTLIQLPTDRPRPAVQRFRGGQVQDFLPDDLAAGVAAVGRRHGATLFMSLLAAFQAFLARISGDPDVLVGTPIAGRNWAETEGLVGLFINTLVVRGDVLGNPDYGELIARSRQAALGVFAHQEVPFEKLVENLQPQRSLAHSPIFQVMFALQNFPPRRFDLPGLEITVYQTDGGTSKFDLNLLFTELDGRLLGTLEYDSDLFDHSTAQRLLGCFETLLRGLVTNPDRWLLDIPLIGEAERHQMLLEWNDTEAPFPLGVCLHELFEAQAAARPEAVAAVFENRRMTYGELDRRANRLAHRLHSSGVGPGRLVAVHLERSPEMLLAVLGIHKAGGTYVPVDVSWPADRVRYILESERIVHVVTEPARLEALPPVDHVLCLDGELETDLEAIPPVPEIGPEDPAYIIFTSGSTGRPKGVVVRHRPAVNLVHWVNTRFCVGPSDTLLFVTSLSFDLSVYDIFGILAAGGTVRIATPTELRDPEALVKILMEEPITFWDSAPAALQQLVPWLPADPQPSAALRLAFNSGDWIPVTLPDRLRHTFPNAEFVSLGGATEATIWSNFFPVGEVAPHWVSIPYGRPIENARYHVLDAGLNPCPVGLPGDLYIAGGCLSDGYASAPDLTAQKYIPNPFGEGRLYRTGDRARYLPDGNLEFLGRVDTQVKVRGFRIELGEIESVLMAHPEVREAVVLARENTPGDQRLVAYFIPDGEAPAPLELRRFVQAKLPEYMVPWVFVPLEAWPLAATGKLDRKALPPPEQALKAMADAPVLPRNALERTIAEIWKKALGLTEVGVHDNFFDLGGHSLLMAQVHDRLKETLGRDLSMVDLFRFPQVAALAKYLETDTEAEADRSEIARAPSGLEIAVIGMAGRFPGAADLEKFWENLSAGVESIHYFSDEELFSAGVHPTLLANPNYVKARGLLGGTDLFDAKLFGLSPHDACVLDPQQRLLLECAWEALEHSGYGSAQWRRGQVGVFAGASENTYYHDLLANPAVVEMFGRGRLSLFNNPDYLAPRISYHLDLEGPSLSVQAACASALVAVHLACSSLVGYQCDLAIAGGVSVRVPERVGYLYEEGGVVSPDGHTRAFDAQAQGSVRSSGVGVIVLKRLEEALADGDTIHAVILGSAFNNSGAQRIGFSAPAADSQARVAQLAYAAAGIDPQTVDYVEGHGTGTFLGDALEITGLTQALHAGGARQPRSCALGSVKTNIGHVDAAAGIAGLLKVILAMQHKEIPPTLHFKTMNEAGRDDSPFYVNTELAAWSRKDHPRRAGVNSIGMGGQNCHIVLEEAPTSLVSSNYAGRSRQLLVLSAATQHSLDAMAERLAAWFTGMPNNLVADAAYTLQVGRKALAYRKFLVCGTGQEAIDLLRAEDFPNKVGSGLCVQEIGNQVMYLLPGRGVEYIGVTTDLYGEEATFRESFDKCAELLRGEMHCDIRELLYLPQSEAGKERQPLYSRSIAEPVLFAIEYSLAQVWMRWGVQPKGMIGHDLGEYVAACLSGVFSLEDGLRLVTERAKFIEAQSQGKMLAVALRESEVWDLLAQWGGRLSLVSLNTGTNCVISGFAQEVENFRELLARQGIDHSLLNATHPVQFSPDDTKLGSFGEVLYRARLNKPKIPFISNVTGRWITDSQATDPSYWIDHLHKPIRFFEGLSSIFGLGAVVLLEVGPGRTLGVLAQQHPERRGAELILHSLDRAEAQGSDFDSMLRNAGALWLAGFDLDWRGLHSGERRRRIPLPTYCFDRKRYWLDLPVRDDVSSELFQQMVGAQADSLSYTSRARVGQPPNENVLHLEEEVAQIWRELLGVERVGRLDDFFDVGGSSLLVLRLISQLNRLFEVELRATAVLEASNVAAMAALVRKFREGNVVSEDRGGGLEQERAADNLRSRDQRHS